MAAKIVELPKCPVCGCNRCDCTVKDLHDAFCKLQIENKEMEERIVRAIGGCDAFLLLDAETFTEEQIVAIKETLEYSEYPQKQEDENGN